MKPNPLQFKADRIRMILSTGSSRVPLTVGFQTSTGYEIVEVVGIFRDEEGATVSGRKQGKAPGSFRYSWTELKDIVVLADGRGAPVFDDDIEAQVRFFVERATELLSRINNDIVSLKIAMWQRN